MRDSDQTFQTSVRKLGADYLAPDGSEIRPLPTMTIMTLKVFADLIDAIGKGGGSVNAIVNLPEAEREKIPRTLDEPYRPDQRGHPWRYARGRPRRIQREGWARPERRGLIQLCGRDHGSNEQSLERVTNGNTE